MRKNNHVNLLIAALALSGLLLTACERQGPVERTGEQIDEAADDIGDGLDDAADEIDRD